MARLNTAMIITIDGPAGSGKSTVAARLARRLAIAYLDTGAMYRAVTLCALEEGVDMDDVAALESLARNCDIQLCHKENENQVCLNGRDVTETIRRSEVTDAAHKIAKQAAVRELLVSQQRRIAEQNQSLVTEGRDQGSVVFPQATYKFYLDASPQCRAQRRWQELKRKNENVTLDEVLAAQEQRDQRDASRDVSPLRIPEDAIVIDTTNMTIEEVVESLYQYIKGER